MQDNCRHQPPLDHASPGRIAGIDFGTVRIGIALSDPSRTLASPHETYTRTSPERDVQFFRRLIADEDVVLLVVGLPVHLDGRESAKSVEARRFARWLSEATGVAVELFDERFSTVEADALLAQRDLSPARRKKRRDAMAAQVMLTAYLEQRAARGADSRGSDETNGSARGNPPGALDD